jgi:hypothetical protein
LAPALGVRHLLRAALRFPELLRGESAKAIGAVVLGLLVYLAIGRTKRE